jgi:hypothetical protein
MIPPLWSKPMFRNTVRSFLMVTLASILITNTGCGRSDMQAQSTSGANSRPALVNVGAVPVNSVPDSGNVDGVVETFTPAEGDLENSFLNQAVPYIFLNFTLKDETVEKVELPDEARKVANDYWKAALIYRWKADINRPPDSRTYVDTQVNYLQASNNADRGFQKIRLNTPTGTRVISYEEAHGLIRFISHAAITVTEQAKEQKGK